MADTLPTDADAPLPSADEFFGKEPLPSADDFFGPQRTGTAIPSPLSGAFWDHYLSNPVGDILSGAQRVITAPGRVLDAFGHGVVQGWGEDRLGWSGASEDGLKKLGIFSDAQKGQGGVVRAFNEALLRPAAVAMDAAMRGGTALFGGAQAAIAQTGAEAGAPQLGHELAAVPEAFMGMPHGLGVPDLNVAQEMRVIGGTEADFKGTAPATEFMPAGTTYKFNVPAEAKAGGETMQPYAPTISHDVMPPDVHVAARSIDPPTFEKFDALAAQRDELRTRIAEAQAKLRAEAEAQAPHAAEIADLQERLQDTTPRLAKKYQARLEQMIPERDAFLASDQMQMLVRDTPEIQAMRQQLQEADYGMRDLAPQVTAAYQEAAKRVPAEEAPAAEPAPVAAAPVETPAAEAPAAAPTPVETPAAAPVETTPEAKPAPPPATPAPAAAPPPDVAADISKKLQAAGRPAEEADAAGQLIAAHYDARAARFGGAKGTGPELYAAEGPDIRAGRAQKAPAMELAQRQAGKIRFADEARAVITLARTADASTFLHETGHAWLEELTRDARDERAPADLTRDAQTVRDWLGNKGGEFTTRQHEKFARGFEQYMMEGHAPSQALAGVFAKFKNWLTGIYQTLTRLGKPITPDIRDVFNRLLARPDEAVVAPDREPIAHELPSPHVSERVTSDLADVHETDARETPPDQAGSVADQVRQEIDQTAATHAPELADELANAGRDGSRGRTEGGASEAGAAGSEAARGAGPGAGQPGALDQGRDSAAPEGNRSPQKPADEFGTPDTGLIDKAGNIRLDLLNQPKDVLQVIRDAADENNEFIDARRGVIPDQQVLDLAEALGMTPEQLNQRKLGQAFNAEQVVAARKLLVQSANGVREAMLKAAVGSDADVMAYAEAKTRHRMIQEQVAGLTAEAGRALRAFRSLAGEGEAKSLGAFLEQNTGRTLFQLRKEAELGAKLDTPGQVSKFVGDMSKRGAWDMVLEYWINGLISGPATHTTYAVGNALLTMWKALPETLVSGVIGKLHGGEKVYLGEVGAQLHGIMTGVPRGIVAGWEAAKSGQTTRLPGEKTAAFAMQNNRGAVPGMLGEVIRLPSRGVAVIHSMFRAIGYSQELASQAYRTATKEGLSGTEFADRVSQLVTNPPPEMMEAARDAATQQTLMGEGGEFTRKVAELTNTRLFGAPIPKFIAPFVKIGANIMGEGLIQRTPLGLLSSDVRANLLGRNGAVARDIQIARIAVGSAIGAATIGLAAQGFITGGGPSDPREAAAWRATGKQPYSVRVGDTWYGVHRLGPIAMIMGVAADLHELGEAVGAGATDKIAGLVVGSLAKSIMDETWMRGLSDLLKAINDPDREGAKWARHEAASFVPFSVGMGQVARAVDPYSRQARTMLDQIKAGVPWLSQTLLPRIDVFGQPVPSREALGPEGLSAIYETRVNNDPTVQALVRLHAWPAMPERKIRNVELTDEQYQTFAATSGQMMKTRLDALIRTPGFASLPEGMQQQTIRETISSARETARALTMMQNPQIIQQAIEQKQQLLTTGKKK